LKKIVNKKNYKPLVPKLLLGKGKGSNKVKARIGFVQIKEYYEN
jgi:hypothetical protein